MASREFSEEEIQHLFERAAALQADASDGGGNRPTLSQAELEQIAESAGIAPEFVQRAITEYEQPSVEPEQSRSATHIFVEHRAEASLTNEAWDTIVSQLQLRYDSNLGDLFGLNMTQSDDTGYGKSSVERIGNTRQWSHVSLAGVETRLSATPEGRTTRLSLSQRVGLGSEWTDAVSIGIIVTLVAGLFLRGIDDPPATFGIAALLFVAATAITYKLDVLWRELKHRELADLSKRISDILESSQSPGEHESTGALSDFERSNSVETNAEPLLDQVENQEAKEERATRSRGDRSRE